MTKRLFFGPNGSQDTEQPIRSGPTDPEPRTRDSVELQGTAGATEKTWQPPAEPPGRRSARSGTGSPRCSPTCTSSPWPTRTGGPAGTRNRPCSSSSSGTTRSAAASRCSRGSRTVCCSCAASASRSRVRVGHRVHNNRSKPTGAVPDPGVPPSRVRLVASEEEDTQLS